MSWIFSWKEHLSSLPEGEDFGHNCWEDTPDTIRCFSKLEKFIELGPKPTL